jgi:lysophospholipase L1-like esterase
VGASWRLGALAAFASISLLSCTEPPIPPTIPSRPTPIVTEPQPPAPQPAAPPVLKVTTFVAFGDSQTEGKTSVFPENGRDCPDASLTPLTPFSYTLKLQGLLAARYTTQTFTVWNAGCGGEPTIDALPRLRYVLAGIHPQVLLLMEGANDLFNAESSSAIPTAVAGVQQMIREAKPQVTAVIVATIPGEMAGRSRAQGAPFVAAYNDALRQMALAEGVAVADVYANFDAATLQGADGLHPTDAGYTKIAQVFFDTIKASLEVPTTFAVVHP